MATGRTSDVFQRLYVDGYDLSGDTRKFAEMGVAFELGDTTAVTDAIKNILVDNPMAKLGAVNVLFNNAAAGVHTIASAWASSAHRVMIPIGIRAAPAIGDPVFAGAFNLDDYTSQEDGNVAAATFKWGDWDPTATIQYANLFGILLAHKTARTAVNSSTGLDDNGDSSAFGSFLMYQLFTSNGTVTLKVQDAATNTDPSFADLSGATSGSIDASSSPKSGIVALGETATVRQFLRWQLAFGTATTATFALSFHRAKF